MVCQDGLPSMMVARHKGNIQKKLVVSVEKIGELLWKFGGSSMLQWKYGLYKEV